MLFGACISSLSASGQRPILAFTTDGMGWFEAELVSVLPVLVPVALPVAMTVAAAGGVVWVDTT